MNTFFRAISATIAFLLITSSTRADPLPEAVADAAERNDATAVNELLQQGCDVNRPQVDGMTALHWAAFHSNAAMAQRLVSAGADVTVTNRYKIPPLWIACMNGDGSIVRILLEAGANPQTALPGGETALMAASRTGRLRPVEELISRGANVNARGHKRQTALMWAAAEGNLQAVDALLKAGADEQASLASGFTPLFFAVREGRTSVVKRLLAEDIDIDAPMRGTGRNRANPLLLAVENGHFETAAALLEAGADPNAQPEGHGALHAISWVRKPIRGDGDPSPVGSGAVSALDFVRAMHAYGADVNLKLAAGRSGFADFTTTGSTPFVLAARTGDLPLLKTLLELDADPRLTNADHATALLAATGIGDLGSGQESPGTEAEAIEVARLLLELGADINAVDDNGETVMHGAAYQNWPQMVRFLAEHGADVSIWNRANKWQWTPLLIARGYRKGNFRPDPATIAAIERVMRAAGVTPPEPTADVTANQQSWDKKKPKQKPKADDSKQPKQPSDSPGEPPSRPSRQPQGDSPG